MHIIEVILHNYRGYDHNVIPITPGLNVIFGEGDSGKSALEKALRWCLLNERQGKFVNKKITTKKKNIKSSEEVYVQVTFNTGDTIRRGADSSTNNLYWIGHVDIPFEQWGDPIKNFGNDVPPDVQKVINLSSVNVGKQFDSHFLLSSKGGEIAKDLNKMVNLEIIDTSQSNIKHLVSKIRKEKELAEFNLEKYQKELESYDYLPDMEKALDEVESVQASIQENKESQKEIGLLLNLLDGVEEKIEKLESVITFKSHVENLQELKEKIGGISKEYNIIESALSQLSENKEHIHTCKDVVEFKDNINDIVSVEAEIKEISLTCESICTLLGEADTKEIISEKKKIIAFKPQIEEITSLESKIQSLDSDYEFISKSLDTLEVLFTETKVKKEEILEMKKNLKGVCPTCGRAFDECKEVV
jgi:DNA repair protein SbcC/Rad50